MQSECDFNSAVPLLDFVVAQLCLAECADNHDDMLVSDTRQDSGKSLATCTTERIRRSKIFYAGVISLDVLTQTQQSAQLGAER